MARSEEAQVAKAIAPRCQNFPRKPARGASAGSLLSAEQRRSQQGRARAAEARLPELHRG